MIKGNHRSRKFYTPRLARWGWFLDAAVWLIFGMMILMLADCVGIQSNRRSAERKPQTSTTAITATEGSIVYSMTFQSLQEDGGAYWVALFGLGMAGWIRSWVNGRRGRLGATRIINEINHNREKCVGEAGVVIYDLITAIKKEGMNYHPKHDHTERWIRSLVKSNRRRRRRDSQRVPGLGLRCPVVFRWPWKSGPAGDGDEI